MTTDPEDLIATARRLIEPVRGMSDLLRDIHVRQGAIMGFPRPDTPGRVPGAAFIDGAVAHEQTDALLWVAATGVSLADDRPSTVNTATGVAPVSGDTERLRSGLMACCELEAATASDEALIFMDGGLATPLISVAQALLVHDPDVRQSIRERYARVDVASLLDRYVDMVEEGRVVALPKQDTASGYATAWATAYEHEFPHPDTSLALARMRDRPLAGALLRPGEMLRPRPAQELARTELKHENGDPLAARLAPHYDRLARAENLHVMYVQPRRLTDRVIKAEYREADPTTWATGQSLAALVDGVTIGPRVKEPMPQYQVDGAAKKSVTSTLAALMQDAQTALDGDAGATSRYRT